MLKTAYKRAISVILSFAQEGKDIQKIVPIRTDKDLAATIDNTLITATATGPQIRQLCRQSLEYGFHTACVNSRWVSLAADILYGSGVKVGATVGFPLGAESTEIKVAQAKEVIFGGADEIDMVADLAAIIEGDSKYLSTQLGAVLGVCRSMRPPVLLKVIIEAAALSREQKIFACQIADECGVDFVKTSTGMNAAGGAAIEDVKLMKEVARHCKVKAAGGVRTARGALDMLEVGAERIGTSSAVQIIEQFRAGEL